MLDVYFNRTPFAKMHARRAIFRAVENHRYLVRAAQAGLSMIIDPFGKVIEKTGNVFEPTYLAGNIKLFNDKTFYLKFGDIFAMTCVALVLYLIILPKIK